MGGWVPASAQAHLVRSRQASPGVPCGWSPGHLRGWSPEPLLTLAGGRSEVRQGRCGPGWPLGGEGTTLGGEGTEWAVGLWGAAAV